MIPNKVIKVGYRVVNGGDGSAYPEFTQTKEIAEIAEGKDNEEGWAEPSAGELKIYIDDKNNFFLREYEFIDREFIYNFVPLEVEEIGD